MSLNALFERINAIYPWYPGRVCLWLHVSHYWPLKWWERQQAWPRWQSKRTCLLELRCPGLKWRHSGPVSLLIELRSVAGRGGLCGRAVAESGLRAAGAGVRPDPSALRAAEDADGLARACLRWQRPRFGTERAVSTGLRR
ncbi:hypothetical protein NDU88_005526 [Pleurodeles waltl]|uniref:Uncharacterized protein n=1 Tax=Pleurodeles waltl TaxID=8319 RepID=A0AAV7MYQ4_PLEWA|nr:hypothetical protein NDU88_005526 [Pleurodeles waltl]